MITYKGTVLSRLPNGMMQVKIDIYDDNVLISTVTVPASDNYRISSVNQDIGDGGLPIRQTSNKDWAIG